VELSLFASANIEKDADFSILFFRFDCGLNIEIEVEVLTDGTFKNIGPFGKLKPNFT